MHSATSMSAASVRVRRYRSYGRGYLSGLGRFGAGLLADICAVEVLDGVAGDRWHARPGEHDADEVDRVDSADVHTLSGVLLAADATEGLDGLREGVLLADEAGDEATAADGAARLEAAEGAEDLAPGDGERLACDDIAEDDAVAEEQDAGDALSEGLYVGVGGYGGGGLDERPAAGRAATGTQIAGTTATTPTSAPRCRSVSGVRRRRSLTC